MDLAGNGPTLHFNTFCPLNRNAFSLRNPEKQKFENLKIKKSLKKKSENMEERRRKSEKAKKSHKKLAK